MVTVEQIKSLREETGISIAECKKALESANGDMDVARVALGAASVKNAAKKAGRTLGAGVIGEYVHTGRTMAALVELDCETDFVARNEEFIRLASELAMQVAALEPADTTALLEQPFIKDSSLTVAMVIKNTVQKFGERVEVSRFVRMSVGQ
ncbi:elongation factor Ts [Candidatus Nomurabacteria bacterium]|nr:elongation factor Ts [Candidatus Nomurabacteria bacterium]